MGNLTSTASDIITGALINITAYAVGQPLTNQVASTCMQVLNDLLDSLSTDQAFIYTQTENILVWNPGQFEYTVGNPVSSSTFTGTLTLGSPIITGATVPAGVIFESDVTDNQALLPAGTEVLSFTPTTVTLDQNATANSTGLDVFTYTTPGNFKIPRPLRIRSSFTRVTNSAAAGLDYWFDIVSLDRYNEIGLKSVPGPWPYLCAYQQTFPLSTLWVYPNPSIAGEVHLFTDLILSSFPTLTTPVNLPQGYNRALKKLLGLELCPLFGKTPSPQLILQAKEAKDLLKAQNTSPVVTLRYDSDLVRSRHTDAGWIINGGFV
jgi:hypothetical protein